MRLYDNDAYREDFMVLVYELLHSDRTNDRANQIIDAFDMAPAVEAEPLKPNDPLTLEELRKMDGEPVWVETTDVKKANRWTFVDVGCEVVRFFDTRCGVKCSVMGNHFRTYGKTWLAYRRKPEKCVSAPADPAVPGWAEHLNARFLRTE